MALTPKQEKFCMSIVSGMNQSDAYRAAYSCENMLDATVNNNAYMLINGSDIKARIEALRLPLGERLGIGIEKYIRQLEEMRMEAQGDREHNPAIKAHELIGKALGYYVNKTELSGRDGGAIDVKIVREIIDQNDKDTNS